MLLNHSFQDSGILWGASGTRLTSLRVLLCWRGDGGPHPVILGIIPGSALHYSTSAFLMDNMDSRDCQPYLSFLDPLSCYSILLLCFLSFLFLSHSGDAHGFLLALCSGFTPDGPQDQWCAGPVCTLETPVSLALVCPS